MKQWLYLLCIFSVLHLTCSLEKPLAPKWDTQINVPMIDRTYTIRELIEGKKEFGIGADGLVFFHFEKELEKTYVGDKLSLPDLSESFHLGLEAFHIPDLPVQTDRYYFRQLTTEVIIKDQTTSTIAAFSFNNVPSEEHSTGDLRYAVLTQGIIRIHAYNSLPVELQNVLLTLQDPVSQRLILSTPLIPKIASQDTVLAEINAAGILFPPNARWLLSGNSPGSNGRIITIDQNAKVEVLAELLEAVVSAAEARIPPAKIEHHKEIALQTIGDNAIEEVGFAAGKIRITIDNHSPFTASSLSLQLHQFRRNKTNEPLSLTLSLLPFQKTTLVIDLADVTAKMDLPQVGQPQLLQMDFLGETTDLREQFLTIDANTYAKIDVEIRDVVLDHFSGRLQQQSVLMDSTVRDIQISDRLGDLQGVHLNDARMSLTIYNTIQLPLRFQGALYGFNKSGSTASLTIDQDILPGNSHSESRTTLPLFTPQNSNLLEVINMQPTQLALAGKVLVGDGSSYGKVNKNDYIRGTYTLDLPLYASWQPRTIIGDTTKVYIEPETAESEEKGKVTLPAKVTKHIRSAELILNVENSLPIGGQVRFYFAVDTTRLFASPDVQPEPVTFPAASVDENGKAKTTTFQIKMTLSPEDIKLFQNEGNQVKTIYVVEDLMIYGTNGKKVKVYANDFLRLRGLLLLTISVGDF